MYITFQKIVSHARTHARTHTFKPINKIVIYITYEDEVPKSDYLHFF